LAGRFHPGVPVTPLPFPSRADSGQISGIFLAAFIINFVALSGLTVKLEYVGGETMVAELIAGLRGIIGDVASHAGHPLFLYLIVLAVYIIYRKTS
jgi:hypothetical protein